MKHLFVIWIMLSSAHISLTQPLDACQHLKNVLQLKDVQEWAKLCDTNDEPRTIIDFYLKFSSCKEISACNKLIPIAETDSIIRLDDAPYFYRSGHDPWRKLIAKFNEKDSLYYITISVGNCHLTYTTLKNDEKPYYTLKSNGCF